MKIGFIGTGKMGAPMARNLARAGHSVTGFDPQAAMPGGVATADDAAAAVRGAEVVVTMLPKGDVLRSVADTVVPAMAPGAVLVDCSTVDIESARAVAALARTAEIGFLDAPVSGGTVGADAGTLTFMVGGASDHLDRVRPLLEAMGSRVVHCGAVGAGQAAKLCNNMITGATMAVTCEAFALANALGLDEARFYDVVSTSSGQSWSTTTNCPVPGVGPESPADRDYAAGFAVSLMLKDMTLAVEAAKTVGSPVATGETALRAYRDLADGGEGGRDFSALLPRFKSMRGKQ
ncbi:3-hydroxyisobutyrate dehydrogenase [Jannaschia sp. LMIT008]|uniref:3-hydroxyisobutyrate dehydrogenase n=1 Tax=Jannaschia maritima TaxID=3032585 RepID=UPI0028117EAE|nr:3-hydroxyisobutyrate dehydrogenase [Jannaschia sp. LMIT008]